MEPIAYREHKLHLYSHYLQRYKEISIFIPGDFSARKLYPVIFMNDGQDASSMRVMATLGELHTQKLLREPIVVAVHAAVRIREYGTIGTPDFAGRGDKAAAYAAFLLRELLPLIGRQYNIDPAPEAHAIMGMSLGGLSALDIAWHYPHRFKRVGVFSGAFWWRSKDISQGYTPYCRIIHRLIAEGSLRPGMKFWLQVGTEDEQADRNGSGIIDAIEDTLDVIQLLKYKGYQLDTDIRYLEMRGGKHDQPTWAAAFPDFLLWHFGKQEKLSDLTLL